MVKNSREYNFISTDKLRLGQYGMPDKKEGKCYEKIFFAIRYASICIRNILPKGRPDEN